MKRVLSLLLIVATLTCLLSAVAYAWYCPECGTDCSGNFCSNCGTKKPSSSGGTTTTSSSFRVTDAVLENDGSVSVYWTGGQAPYHIDYEFYVSSDYNNGVDVISWTNSNEYYGTSGNLDDSIVPGERYWIIVVDGNGQEAWYDFRSRASAFNEVSGMRLTFSLRENRNNRSQTVDSFTASDIQRNLTSNTYGATIKISTPKLQQDHYYNIRMAVFLPNGEPLLMHTSYETFEKRYDYVYWESYDFRWVWDTIVETKDRIPSGRYTFRIYADDMLLGEAMFNLR